jgi:hypothetical protein
MTGGAVAVGPRIESAGTMDTTLTVLFNGQTKPEILMQHTSDRSNVITFLSPLTFNQHFLSAFIGEETPCAALGIVETAGKEKGFIALKVEWKIGSLQRGFDLSTDLFGSGDFAMLHLVFNFGIDHVYDVLLNLGAAATKRVLSVWKETGDHCFFIFQGRDLTAFHQILSPQWNEHNYFGIMENVVSPQSRYDSAVASFKNKKMVHGLLFDVKYQDREEFLDLKANRFEVRPAG